MRAIKVTWDLRVIRPALLDIFWKYAPAALRERAVWTLAPKFLVTVNGACLNPRDRVLLLEQRYPRPDRWNMPGGFVRHGEHPEATLVREVREETGLDAVVSQLLWVFNTSKQIHLCYLCFVPDREPVLQRGEIMSYEWVDLLSPDPRRTIERRRAAEVLAALPVRDHSFRS